MRAGLAGYGLALGLALCVALSTPALAQGQAFGKIASDILHKALPGDRGNLTKGEVASGLKEALTVAGGAAIKRLSARDGYMGDPAVRIPLPGVLGPALQVLVPMRRQTPSIP